MPDQETGVPAADVAKVLLENQKENEAFIRHYEDVRFKITQVTVTLAGLLIGASRFAPQNPPAGGKLPIALFIVTLGIIGILISAKYSERADRHAVIARSYRRAVSRLIGQFQGTEIEQLHETAASQHASSRSVTGLLYTIRARYFWLAVHVCVVFLGILVALI